MAAHLRLQTRDSGDVLPVRRSWPNTYCSAEGFTRTDVTGLEEQEPLFPRMSRSSEEGFPPLPTVTTFAAAQTPVDLSRVKQPEILMGGSRSRHIWEVVFEQRLGRGVRYSTASRKGQVQGHLTDPNGKSFVDSHIL